MAYKLTGLTGLEAYGQEKLLEARFRVSLANMGEDLRILINCSYGNNFLFRPAKRGQVRGRVLLNI